MRRAKYKKKNKLQPNALEYNGEFSDAPISMQLFVYTEEEYKEYVDISLAEVQAILSSAPPDAVKWFNLHGLHNIELLNEIGELFSIQSYIMAEILNFSRRTRVEEVDNVLFFSLKAILPFQELNGEIQNEQISFILKDNTLLSFQEQQGHLFTVIRERIRTKIGQVRKRDNGYLLYLLMDSITDSFFNALDWIEDRVELVLIDAKNNYKKNILVLIEEYTQELQDIKRAIVPFREVLHNLIIDRDKREELSILSKSSLMFYSRLQYKTNEILDQVEYNLNKLDSATNHFFSAQSNRMNEIMKVLTIVSVIFIPLTFIVGVYGMNFENMPELKVQNGYFYTLIAMFLIVLVMLGFFKWKKWF